MFPRALLRQAREKSRYELSAANSSAISTYSTININLNLGLRRDFPWRFVVADVTKAIIGFNFLAYYDLLVDVKNRRLIDSTTKLAASGKVVTQTISSVKIVSGTTRYHELLSQYPEITRPDGSAIMKHNTVYHIKTRSGPPVVNKPWRLSPTKLKAAKKEFNTLIKLGIWHPAYGTRHKLSSDSSTRFLWILISASLISMIF